MILANFLVALVFSIFIHELGHYFAALFYGIKAKEISVCTGPKLVQIRVNGTDFNLKLFPTGGYNEWPEDAINKAGLLQSLVVNLSGVFLNYIIAIVAWCIAFNKTFIFVFNKVNLYFIKYIFGEIKSFNVSYIYFLSENLSNNLCMLYKQGIFHNFWFVLGTINFALFLINLIPFPTLDGGQVIEVIINKILLRLKISYSILYWLKALICAVVNFMIYSQLFISKMIVGIKNYYSIIQLFLVWMLIPFLFFIVMIIIRSTEIYKKFLKL